MVTQSLSTSRPVHDEAGLGTLRHYQATMRREYPEQPVPDLADVIGGAYGFRACPDDGLRMQIDRALIRTLTTRGSDGFNLPAGLANGLLDSIGVRRTMSEITGGAGGFATKPQWTMDIFDRARQEVGPWNLISWEPCSTKTLKIPIAGEVTGSTGFQATWGYGELNLPPATDALLSEISLDLSRLLIYTRVSKDLLADSQSIRRWLAYRARSQIRSSLEYALVNGGNTTTGSPAPVGALTAPSTVGVARTTSNQIAAKDIDAMWQSLNVACRPNAVWHCSQSALDYLDSIDSSGQFPRSVYIPASDNTNYGAPYGMIKNRPIIPLGSCPVLGTPGDIFVVDWSQYVLAYYQYGPTDSFLSFDVMPPSDQFHRGVVGLPFDSVEARATEHFSFSTDVADVVFKLRAMGGFIWPKAVTGMNGITTGPCVALT